LRKSAMSATTRKKTAVTVTTSVLPPLDRRAKSKPGPKPLLQPNDETLDKLRALAKIQTTIEEAAAVLRVSKRSLTAFLADYEDARKAFDEGRLEGFVSLRRKQFAMAEKNPTMAIWLGKQYLGQVDHRQLEVGGPGDFDKMSTDELRDYIRNEAQALGLGSVEAAGQGRGAGARKALN